MKKAVLAVVFIIALGLSFFAGSKYREGREESARAEKCSSLMVLAADKADALSDKYEDDTMEALISNIYAACQYCDDTELAAALHELWNALIFDGKNISGNEVELISALKDGSASAIESIAAELR